MIKDEKLEQMADKAEDIDWQTATQDQMAGYAMVTLKISHASGQWTLRSVLAKMMLQYCIIAAGTILIAYKCGMQPLLIALVNVVIAAVLSGFYQLRAQHFAGRVGAAIQEHDRYLEKLSRIKNGENK